MDIKYENILMGLKSPDPWCEHERQPEIKVCDFTLATHLVNKRHIRYGTLPFSAPEVFNEEQQYPKALDVWAFGITVFIYIQDSFPFSDTGNIDKNIINTNFAEQVDSLTVSSDLKTLLKQILHMNPSSRPTFE